MKRNFLGLLALVLAIGVSSFTAKFAPLYYLVYSGAGAHNSMASYAAPTTIAPAPNAGTAQLYFVAVEDINGVANIQTAEFNAGFAKIDVATVDNNLNNEIERTTTYTLPGFPAAQVRLEKKF
jgi:hypothetical protein